MHVNRERLWDHARVLCEEIGPRLSGTPADERTIEYIAGHDDVWLTTSDDIADWHLGARSLPADESTTTT